MAKRFIKILILLSICSVLTACQGLPIPEEKKDYIGTWLGDGMMLVITKDGGIQYERVSGKGTKKITAPLQEFQGDDFVAGVLFIKTTFHVKEKPFQDGATWKMVVDDVELTKSTGRIGLTVPDTDILETLAKESMNDFARSVKGDDFAVAYDGISKLWQSETSAGELRDVFKAFIEREIDLMPLTSLDPVFSEPPYISEEHRLVLNGYYTAQPMVQFTFQYVYEHPKWALSGININM